MPRVRTNALHTPVGFEGVCSSHGITCGICFWVQSHLEVHTSLQEARREARARGWSYHSSCGWFCSRCPAPELTKKQADAISAEEVRKEEKAIRLRARDERRRVMAMNKRAKESQIKSHETPHREPSYGPVRVQIGDIKDYTGPPNSS